MGPYHVTAVQLHVNAELGLHCWYPLNVSLITFYYKQYEGLEEREMVPYTIMVAAARTRSALSMQAESPR